MTARIRRSRLEGVAESDFAYVVGVHARDLREHRDHHAAIAAGDDFLQPYPMPWTIPLVRAAINNETLLPDFVIIDSRGQAAMKIFARLALVCALALIPTIAVGQSSPGLAFGQVPTAAQWNGYFAAKQDYLGFPPVNAASAPLIIGGAGVSDSLTLRATSGAGVGAEYVAIQVGNNGALEAARAAESASNTAAFLIGATTPQLAGPGTTYPEFQVHAISPNSFGLYRWSNDGNPHNLNFVKSRGAAVGTHTIVQSGDLLGNISFSGSDGSIFRPGAQIISYVDGTPGASDMPGRLHLLTTPDGTATAVDRIIIGQDGGVNIGPTATNVGAGVLKVEGTTVATSSTTGIMRVGGGLGVAGAAWVGTYLATTPVAVASLPACAAGTKGARMFVTDSNAASFTAGIGAVVAAGGATQVPVTCDGTNWRIG